MSLLLHHQLVISGGWREREKGRVVHAAGGLSEWEEEPPVWTVLFLCSLSLHVCVSVFDYITWPQQHLNSHFSFQKYRKNKEWKETVEREDPFFADGKERGGEDPPPKKGGVTPPQGEGGG